MIKKVKLEDFASFKRETNILLNKVNFFYGGNGTGKTSISKVLKGGDLPKGCEILAEGEYKTVVYNKPFVDLHFSDSSRLKGIYTLGTDSLEQQKRIDDELESLDKCNNQYESIREIIEVNRKAILSAQDEIETICWRFKKEVYPELKEILKGNIGNKELFKSYILKCLEKDDTSISLSNVKERYTNLFKDELEEMDFITQVELIDVNDINNILQLPIIGNVDSVFGPIIEKLSNADWVKQGNTYLNFSDGICPYCQQDLPKNFNTKILEFFNEEYELQVNNLEKIYSHTRIMFDEILEKLQLDMGAYHEIFDLEKLHTALLLFEQKEKEVLQILSEKITEPSRVFAKVDINSYIKKINEEIVEINELIRINNDNFNNFTEKSTELKIDLMKVMKMMVKPHIENEIKKSNGLEKTVADLESKSLEKLKEITRIKRDIKDLEREVTSIKHSVNEINKILMSFGYEDFYLELSDEEGFYMIKRNDGTLVEETLSEGEKRFITFLYFYQLIKGSQEVSGINDDKIIVIDDPISSLDSSILYIVSTLVKNLINLVYDGKSNLKQIIILTHNVYFHKEITFVPARRKKNNAERSFFIVRKINGNSFVETYEKNVIETTYQMLWEELHEEKPKNKSTVYNTMRRILEYYFNIIGGADYEKLISEFTGPDKLMASSLLSYVNDGSHYISDDFAMSLSQEDIGKYIVVFKDVFDKLGHINHFNMMMKIDS